MVQPRHNPARTHFCGGGMFLVWRKVCSGLARAMRLRTEVECRASCILTILTRFPILTTSSTSSPGPGMGMECVCAECVGFGRATNKPEQPAPSFSEWGDGIFLYMGGSASPLNALPCHF